MKSKDKKEMTLKELEEHKLNFEKSIANVMNQFKKITGVSIGDIFITETFNEEKSVWERGVYAELDFN